MEDPFSALHKSLQPVFQLEAMRNGKYSYPAVQQLKDSINQYDNNASKSNFIKLLKATREAMPYIAKWRVDFNAVRESMDALTRIHQMHPINWTNLLAHPKVSSKFQFSALNHSPAEDDLLVWITSKSGKPFAKLDHAELTQTLVDHRDHHGFSQKLNKHLQQNPDFLFNLIMKSEKNFIKVSNTRLILYLTDQQLALAIIKHLPVLTIKQQEPYEQVTLLVNKLNDLLSNGRSVSNLLRNTEAKAILDNSVFFQIYQSDEYQNRDELQQQLPSQEPEAVKPAF